MGVSGQIVSKLSIYLGDDIAGPINKLYDCNPTDFTWGPILHDTTKITGKASLSGKIMGQEDGEPAHTAATLDQIDAFINDGHTADFVETRTGKTRLTKAFLESELGAYPGRGDGRIAALTAWIDWWKLAIHKFNYIYMAKSGGANADLSALDGTWDTYYENSHADREDDWDAAKTTKTGNDVVSASKKASGSYYELLGGCGIALDGKQRNRSLYNFVNAKCTTSVLESTVDRKSVV